MRRTIPALLALATVVGLAAPAHAAEEPTERTAIDLSCEATTTDAGKPAISCEWDAVDGAAAYRVMVTQRHGRRAVSVVRRTEETSVSHRARPGTYLIGVQAIDEDRHPLGRSKRVKVTVERPEHEGSGGATTSDEGAEAPADA